MDIRKDIFLKHAAEAAIEQLSSEYQQMGFNIVTEPKIVDIGADIIVKKGDEVIVFEIKLSEWSEEKRRAVRQIRNRAIHEIGAKFMLVLVNLPEEAEIVVEDLEIMFDELLSEHFVDEFSRLATHTWIDEISDIEISNIFIRKVDMDIKGSALVSIGLQYGSDIDFKKGDGIKTSETFPFHFHILVDRNLDVKEIHSLELDKPEDYE